MDEHVARAIMEGSVLFASFNALWDVRMGGVVCKTDIVNAQTVLMVPHVMSVYRESTVIDVNMIVLVDVKMTHVRKKLDNANV